MDFLSYWSSLLLIMMASSRKIQIWILRGTATSGWNRKLNVGSLPTKKKTEKELTYYCNWHNITFTAVSTHIFLAKSNALHTGAKSEINWLLTTTFYMVTQVAENCAYPPEKCLSQQYFPDQCFYRPDPCCPHSLCL